MRAEFDSQANALSIDLVDEIDRYDEADQVDDDYCTVASSDGRPVNVELLSPADHLDLLAVAAERFDLDPQALEAAARSALAAPDRVVLLRVLARAATA